MVRTLWRGHVSYSMGLKDMSAAVSRVEAGGPAEVLGFEFDPVITLGRRGAVAEDILADALALRTRGVEVSLVDRGGEATLHSRGQLVIYPIINLRAMDMGVREFVQGLIKVSSGCLSLFGVQTTGDLQTGVFTERGKIGFVGLRVSCGITSHGVALNVANDLNEFSLIRSCGCLGRAHDRLVDWGKNPKLTEVYDVWCRLFSSHFALTAKRGHDLFEPHFVGI